MIKKWKVIDIGDNLTVFRTWIDEKEDLDFAGFIIETYVNQWGYSIDGIIKIALHNDTFYDIITTLPFTEYQQNNNFFEFQIDKMESIGIK